MQPFIPTLGAKETSKNVRGFMRDNMNVFWDILKPMMPYLIGLAVLDLLIPLFFFEPNPETGERSEFALGGIISGYFFTCLVISWHRVVIHGPDQYVPVNPFKPQKSELMFMGMGLLIFIALFLIAFAVGGIAALISPVLLIVVVPLLVVFAMIIGLKISFYFPAMATGNKLSLRGAYDMTTGYIWKFLGASFLAPLKIWLFMILYILGGMVALFGIVFFFSGAGDLISLGFGLLFALPILLYFQPILMVIGVTVLSNYYQHALQNKMEPASVST